ncbi:hypothetical protein BHE74_00015587 [Ensete ventricosum]|nr:hypothetical protein BHE74_00015587 [Ensete ventricosum]
MVEQGQVFRTPHLFPISTPGQMCGLGFPTSPSLAKARLTLPDLHALGEGGGRVSRPQHLEARIGLIDLHDLGEGEGRASRLPHHDKRRVSGAPSNNKGWKEHWFLISSEIGYSSGMAVVSSTPPTTVHEQSIETSGPTRFDRPSSIGKSKKKKKVV